MRAGLMLAGLVVTALLLSACAGHEWATPFDIARALGGDPSLRSRLLAEWRLPRVVAAGLVGALLGLGGAIFQGVFRNPLAEPYLLGSAGGAAVGATVALLVPFGVPSGLALALLSFAGAWGATVIVLAVGRLAGTFDAAGLLLAGVAVAAMLGAVRSFLMLALSDEMVSLQVVLSWTLGGIQTPTWWGVALLLALAAGCMIVSLALARGLDLLGLGSDMAHGFGLDPGRFVRTTVLAAAAIVAVAVAYGGLVAFVGLIAPHIGRWWIGPRHKALLPASAALGAIFVLLCDGMARSVLPPAEIPLGLVTAMMGGPFFLVILARRLRA